MHSQNLRVKSVVSAVVVALAAVAARAEEKPAMDMQAMAAAMEKMGALNENHKLLKALVGKWDYRIKMWMSPDAPPQESTGKCVTKPVMGGRYFHSEHSGKMEMPGPDGKPMKKEFKGEGLNGYDNMKQKFFGAWIDNMSTGLLVLEGAYDAASKTFTYGGEMECPMSAPGTKLKIREVVKLVSPDQYLFEWYETRDGKESRTMEITYTRRK